MVTYGNGSLPSSALSSVAPLPLMKRDEFYSTRIPVRVCFPPLNHSSTRCDSHGASSYTSCQSRLSGREETLPHSLCVLPLTSRRAHDVTGNKLRYQRPPWRKNLTLAAQLQVRNFYYIKSQFHICLLKGNVHTNVSVISVNWMASG